MKLPRWGEWTQATGQLAELTRRYARYSRSAAGIGSVLGGVLALVAYFVGALAPLGVGSRVLLAATPLVWIAAKEVLQRRYYQRYGRVVEVVGARERRTHIGLTLFTALVSAAIVAWMVIRMVLGEQSSLAEPRWLGYGAFVVAMPFLVWRCLRTTEEYVVGVFLIAQAAVVVGGGHYALGQQPQAPIFGVVLIVLGVRQHLEFRELERRLLKGGVLE